MARTRGSQNLLASLAGAVVGAAAAGGTYWLRRQRGPGGTGQDRANARLETEVVDALCEDEVAGACPIDVAAVGHGVIELSGTVPDDDAAERAAEVVQRVAGVHTVVNRLDIERVERQLADTRRRHEAGAPELQQSGWEGMRAGMGARRQGPTDPARADDSVDMKEDAIGLDGRIR
jgi:hypothetical protein